MECLELEVITNDRGRVLEARRKRPGVTPWPEDEVMPAPEVLQENRPGCQDL